MQQIRGHQKPCWGSLLATAVTLACTLASRLSHAVPLPPLGQAKWIWSQESNEHSHLRKTSTLSSTPTNAIVLITADNGYELYVNGSRVGSEVGAASEVWQSVERYDISSRLARGRNILGIHGIDLGGVRGVIAAVRVETKGQPPLELATDETWRAAGDGQPVDYSHPEFVETAKWRDARVVGPMGMAPWGELSWSPAGERSLSRRSQPRLELTQPGPNFSWPEGVAFVGDDCSVYVLLRGDAWGVVFRVGDWSRAYTEFDLPCPTKIGRKLCALSWPPRDSGANAPRAPHLRLLLDAGTGVLGSPSVSFDGRSLLMAMARAGEKFFHIYRLPVAGGQPLRLTDGPFHDIDPAELPDGRIVFTSTRIGTFEEYHQPPARALFRMNADGTDIHLLTATPIFDNEPKVMANGRIAFVREDNFFDRGKVETHLHSVRPDGTDGLAEFAAHDPSPPHSVWRGADPRPRFGISSPPRLPTPRAHATRDRRFGLGGSAAQQTRPGHGHGGDARAGGAFAGLAPGD